MSPAPERRWQPWKVRGAPSYAVAGPNLRIPSTYPWISLEYLPVFQHISPVDSYTFLASSWTRWQDAGRQTSLFPAKKGKRMSEKLPNMGQWLNAPKWQLVGQNCTFGTPCLTHTHMLLVGLTILSDFLCTHQESMRARGPKAFSTNEPKKWSFCHTLFVVKHPNQTSEIKALNHVESAIGTST